MVSIRRTLSPLKRSSPLSNQDDSHISLSRFSSSSSSSSTSSISVLTSLWALLFGVRTSHNPRRQHLPSASSLLIWKKKVIVRSFLFFVIGFLLGLYDLYHHQISYNGTKKESEKRKTVDLTILHNGASASIIRVTQGAETGIDASNSLVSRGVETRIDPGEFGSTRRYDGEKAEVLLIVVTSTSTRAMQGFYLAKLGQTLRLVRPPLLWIVVEEEDDVASLETADALRRTGVMYRHLTCSVSNSTVRNREIRHKNVALEHIERHRIDGIVYFADENNVYSFGMFQRIRDIRRFGTWPVAMFANAKSKVILEGPVCNGSQITGFHVDQSSRRLQRFYVDMPGFAFNSTILWDHEIWKLLTSNVIRQVHNILEEFQVTTFIEQIVEDESQMEAIPSGCSEIMVWHLHLDDSGFHYPRGWKLSRNLETVLPLSL